ncbi:hypothetical protein H8B02_16830, partial [Bradyrhizobium sp. Pear77]|uniref:hypothetical protein n=1 Tax=Bradyrhizobium altum TaxID=1571202 RepID=UPI001E3ABADF
MPQASRRYDILHALLATPAYPMDGPIRQGNDYMITLVFGELRQIEDWFKKLPGRERQYVPRSEHLHQLIGPLLEDLLFLGQSYDPLFDRFELFLALTCGF